MTENEIRVLIGCIKGGNVDKGIYRYYRNYYCDHSTEHKNLISKRLIYKCHTDDASKMSSFHLTEKGFDYLVDLLWGIGIRKIKPKEGE